MAEIGIQYCGLALIILLMYFSYRRRNLGLHSDRTYHFALVSANICLLSDVLSIQALAHMDLWPMLITKFVCKLYINMLVFVAFFGFSYIASDLLHRKTRRNAGMISGLIMVVATLVIWISPIYIHTENGDLYTYGPSVTATYIFAVFFVLATIVFAIATAKYVNSRRTVSTLAWMIIWLVAAGIQYFNNSLPMVGFATALGLTILFADLENPETNLDRETGTFTAHALMAFMNQQFEEERPFAGVNIVLNPEEQIFDRRQMRTILITIARRLETIPGSILFRNVASEYALVFKDKNTLEAQFPNIRSLMEQPIETDDGEVELRPYYIIFPDSTLAAGAEEVFAFHSFFMQHDPELDYRIIDAEEVKRIREGLRIKAEISEALREDRVEVFYHPIFSVDQQRFTSAEALARIRNRDGSLMMPGVFIPVAETSDQILHIGQRVFAKVCEFLANHDMEKIGIEYVEVNLSVQQCQRKTLAEEYIAIMEQYHVDPSYINLEITESGSVRNRKTLIANMKALIEYGVRFSLDDFGTGESNLDYIMNMPVHIVKFDRTFTQAYFSSERTKYVIDTIIEMIRGLDMEIVSEGVETQEQYHTMMEKEIDYIQGYYFAKPMPADEFLFFVQSH